MDQDGFFVFEMDSFGYFALAEMQESTGSGYQTGTVTFSAGEGGTLTAMVDGVEISSGDKVVYGKEVVFHGNAGNRLFDSAAGVEFPVPAIR